MLQPRVFVPFLDFLFILVLILVILDHRPEDEKNADITAGNIVFELTWPSNIDVDLDLWVKSPGQRPIGYSNKNSTHLNLLRDDLGQTNDRSGVNFELVLSRAAPSGEYIVTVHLYGLKGNELPVPAHLSILGVGTGNGGYVRRMITRTVELKFDGQEIMVARFMFDADNVRITSHNPVVKLIRSGDDHDN